MTANTTDPGATCVAPVAFDNRPHIHVTNLNDLNEYWENAGSRRSIAVGGRYTHRNGQLWCLGGLAWTVSGPNWVVTATTQEDEFLPDLPVVRAGWPFAFAAARLEVAA